MKHTKKLFAIALTLIMALALTVPAFADETTAGNSNPNDTTNYTQGTITVSNPVVGETYKIYRLLNLESYNQATGAYAYKVNSAWTAFFSQPTIKDVYVAIDTEGYVTWVENASAADFAALAIAYAKANSIAAIESVTAAEGAQVVFDEMELGYYLIDSSLGTLCALDTTNNVVTVFEKNGVPTSDKNVLEDSTNTYGKANTADIIDTIYYQATITIPGGMTTGEIDDISEPTTNPGAQDYVLHDTMDEGLKFESVTGITLNGVAVDAEEYTVVSTGLTDGCSFEVQFGDEFCTALLKDDVIVVSYTATFDSEVDILAGKAYENDAWLSYGDEGGKTTTVATTVTKTYDLDVFKYYNGVDDPETADVNETKQPLANAEFKLYKEEEDGTKKYAVATGPVDDVYTLSAWSTEDAATVFVSPADGDFIIHGLDLDTYFLVETEAPDGYNKLADPIEVTLSAENTIDRDDDNVTDDGEYSTLVEVLNQSGTELPSTGGIGTTIFYVVGALLMAGAGVLLVTKKRMADEE